MDREKKRKKKKCKCGMDMANYPWTKVCRLCYQKRRILTTNNN